MEQKTIGKFIAALRRANGYTQRELADKLCVSDKAVSRWERDECAPDLTLLPVIAEIFGITTDELLRGERNSPDRTFGEPPRPSQKSDKQLKNLMRQKQIRYRNLSVISVGVAAVGLIAAMICNFGLLRARIGLSVGSIFYLAAVICQICFVNLSLSDPADEDEPLTERLCAFNLEILTTSRRIIVSIAELFVATLPLAFAPDAYTGLIAGTWLGYGVAFGTIFGIVCFVCHALFLDTLFIKKTAHLTGKHVPDSELGKKLRRLFLRTVITALAGAVLPMLGMSLIAATEVSAFTEGTEHHSYESFKSYIESKKTYWGEDWMTVEPIADENGEYYVEAPLELCDEDGNVVLEYYWNNREVTEIEFNTDSDDRLPITTYSRSEITRAYALKQDLITACGVLIAVECGLCLSIFFVKQRKLRREWEAEK